MHSQRETKVLMISRSVASNPVTVWGVNYESPSLDEHGLETSKYAACQGTPSDTCELKENMNDACFMACSSFCLGRKQANPSMQHTFLHVCYTYDIQILFVHYILSAAVFSAIKHMLD